MGFETPRMEASPASQDESDIHAQEGERRKEWSQAVDAVSDAEMAEALKEILPTIREGLTQLFDRLTEKEKGRLPLHAKEVRQCVEETTQLQDVTPHMKEKLANTITRERFVWRGPGGFTQACLDVLAVWLNAEALKAGSEPTLEKLKGIRGADGSETAHASSESYGHSLST